MNQAVIRPIMALRYFQINDSGVSAQVFPGLAIQHPMKQHHITHRPLFFPMLYLHDLAHSAVSSTRLVRTIARRRQSFDGVDSVDLGEEVHSDPSSCGNSIQSGGISAWSRAFE